jgi:hypothetical protein
MKKISFVALMAVAPALGAQGVGARVSPQFVNYTLDAPSNVQISEMAIPIFVVMPVTSTFSLDLGTAFASATAKSTGGTQAISSSISGLTDTQIRATMNLGTDLVVLTAGVNIPTGRSTADTSEQAAAALIGNDFLVFPISSMGSGFGGTGGLAFAKPFGEWNLGAGVSVRQSMPFNPYEDPSGTKLRYSPGTETRARLGLDHSYGTGRAAIGFTYSTFGDDQFNGSIYNTGNRFMTQGSLSNSLWNGDYVLNAWNLFRSSGTLADGSPTGTESITEVFGAYGMSTGGGRLEPSVAIRTWMQADAASSLASTLSLRYERALGGRMVVSPAAGFTFGKLGSAKSASASTAQSASLSGYRLQLTIRAQ